MEIETNSLLNQQLVGRILTIVEADPTSLSPDQRISHTFQLRPEPKAGHFVQVPFSSIVSCGQPVVRHRRLGTANDLFVVHGPFVAVGSYPAADDVNYPQLRRLRKAMNKAACSRGRPKP